MVNKEKTSNLHLHQIYHGGLEDLKPGLISMKGPMMSTNESIKALACFVRKLELFFEWQFQCRGPAEFLREGDSGRLQTPISQDLLLCSCSLALKVDAG